MANENEKQSEEKAKIVPLHEDMSTHEHDDESYVKALEHQEKIKKDLEQ